LHKKYLPKHVALYYGYSRNEPKTAKPIITTTGAKGTKHEGKMYSETAKKLVSHFYKPEKGHTIEKGEVKTD